MEIGYEKLGKLPDIKRDDKEESLLKGRFQFCFFAAALNSCKAFLIAFRSGAVTSFCRKPAAPGKPLI
jgi:hypothetical protein